MIILILWLMLLLYTYLIYPLFLWLLSKNYPSLPYIQFLSNDTLPEVHIIIPVHNEAEIIFRKLMSIYDSNFQHSKIHVYVGLDNCSDQSLAEVQKFKDLCLLDLQYINNKERCGKPQTLNLIIESFQLKSGILIFSDANVLLTPDTIPGLITYFKDPQVGLVDARFKVSKDIYSHELEGDYVSFEQNIKYWESLIFGAMQGPFGGCFAIKASLFHPIPANFLVDDFFIAMQVMQKGYKAIVNPDAMVIEEVHTDWSEEFRRKKRIATGNFQNLSYYKHVFRKPFTPLVFCFLSHKVIRWMIPLISFPLFLLMLVEIVFIWKLPTLAIIMITIIILAFCVFYISHKLNLQSKTLQRFGYFLYINVALVAGFFNYLKGVQSNVWEPTKRN